MSPLTAYDEELEGLLLLSGRDLIAEAAAEFDRVAGTHSEQIVLFGAGELGKITLSGLRKLGKDPIAFADNNAAIWGRDLGGIPILSPEQAVRNWNDRATFVVSIYTTGPVFQQLSALGCRRAIHYAHLFARHRAAFLPFLCLGQPERVFEEASAVRNAFHLFSTDDSRRTFLTQLKRRLFLEFGQPPVASPPELRLTEYFPTDLYSPIDDESFVDSGAYDGDTIRRFLKLRGGKFREILAIEPDPLSFEKLRRTISTLPEETRSRIHLRKAAASDRRTTLRFSGGGSVWAGVDPNGTMEVEAEPLDEMVVGLRPTLIKMDLEGGEIEAIQGSHQTIERDFPVLAITVYHRVDHLWRIPLLIDQIHPGYFFFLRAHAPDCWDVSCYAVPPGRRVSKAP